MIRCVNELFNGGTASTTPISSYDPDKINLGSLMQIYTGVSNEDNFIGPLKIGLARPMEASTAIAVAYPHVYRFSDTIDWIFLFENSTAAATRRVVLYEFDRTTSIFAWKGFILCTFPPNTNHTIKGGRVLIEKYTTGTIETSGTSVTGTGTDWTTNRMTVGSRIGFGSTDPTQITQWYLISAVGSNTSITLTTSAGTISAGTSYVIEDMKIVISTTNATATNGGLFVVKGCSYNDFVANTTVPAAVSTDNIKAVYWLADASTVTNTTAGGVAIDDFEDWSNQSVYVLNTTTNIRVFKYNFRKALTLASGKDTTCLLLQTGNQTLTGAVSGTNNGRIGTLSHGPLSGTKSLYFVTASRCYGTPVSSITAGNTSWAANAMVEIPPGGANTYAATAGFALVEIASGIDRLVIMTTGAAGVRSYVTQFNTTSNPFDHIFLTDDKQLDQSLADSGGPMHPTINATAMSVWSEEGVLYLCRNGTTAALNQIYTLPINAHRQYAFDNNQVIITRKIDISSSTKLYNIYVNSVNEMGSDTFSIPPEPFSVYYRTSGIDDNTGGWTVLDNSGDLSGISGSSIQFLFTFKILGSFCVPARILGISLVYEDDSTDSHYEPSLSQSSIASRIFSWRQGSTWGGTIPNLRIRIWNIDLNTLVLEDTTSASLYGDWEYSTNDGSTWNPWSSGADTIGNYIRYTADSITPGIKTRVVITQA